jgi:hypothetical protein
VRRFWVFFFVLVAVAALAWGGDLLVRRHTETAIAETLDVVNPTVSIGGVLFVPQLLAGELDEVDVTADALMAEGLELRDFHATLTGVDVAAPLTARTLNGTAHLTAGSITAALGEGVEATVDGGAVVLTMDAAPLSAAVVPHLDGDRIALEVTELSLAGIGVRPADLPLGLGDELDGLSIEVAGLPEGLRLQDIHVVDNSVAVEFVGADVVLD